MEKKFIIKPQRKIPERMEVNVLVLGGGSTGIIAVQAASDDGVKVALIESKSFLGGT